jgi:hypothetical protein
MLITIQPVLKLIVIYFCVISAAGAPFVGHVFY